MPCLLKPIVLNIAISLVLFLTRINKLVITLNAAIKIIRDKIINMTVRSTFNASKNVPLTSFQSLIRYSLLG